MTIHASKGLEFPHVFVVGMEEGLFPSMMSGNTNQNLKRKKIILCCNKNEETIIFISCNIRFKWGQYIDSEESRFLSELDPQFVTRRNFAKSHETEIKPHEIFVKQDRKQRTTCTKKFVKINSKKYNINKVIYLICRMDKL